MISDRLITLEEPITHTFQSSICEKLQCKDYTLTREEVKEFWDIKRVANILYSGSPDQVERIRELYRRYFRKEVEEDFTTKDWLLLGFQGDRPERDLRGGGIMALDLVIYFQDKHRSMVEDMGKEHNSFFFAVTAINIAFFMKKYFHLADFLVPDLDR